MMIDFAEKDAKAEAINFVTIKNGKYRIYEVKDIQYLSHAYVYYLTSIPIYHEVIFGYDNFERLIKYIESEYYTEEELLLPCASLKELEKRGKFLIYQYASQVPLTHTWKYELREDKIIDPLSGFRLFDSADKDFVAHYLQLWKELQKLRRPTTIFPYVDKDVSEFAKASVYFSLIQIADPDDFSLPDVQEYFRSHARDIVKCCYENGRMDIVMYLINNDYIKKPTMQKLLEMANNKKDSQFAAVILDKLKDKQPKNKSAKFVL